MGMVVVVVGGGGGGGGAQAKPDYCMALQYISWRESESFGTPIPTPFHINYGGHGGEPKRICVPLRSSHTISTCLWCIGT